MFGRKNTTPAKAPTLAVNPDLENERKKCTFNTLELTYFLDGGPEKYKERRDKEMFGRKNTTPAKAPTLAVNPDLENERKKCTFNTLELTYFLDGGPEKYKERRDKEDFFLLDPELQDKIPPELLSHEDKYHECLKKAHIFVKKLRKLEEEDQDKTYRRRINIALGVALFKDGNPMALHHGMFIPALLGQGSPEQLDFWLPKALAFQFIGTYAQTELGHGTFIRGLETTATYLPETEQFELNSPTLTSYKWWPGGLGHTANYAIVVAQLYTKGHCHGIFPFIVQLRDEKTHKPMPGITIGEIGPKLGMNATNNGFLGFKKLKIPRMHMLMKNAQVMPDGTFIKPDAAKNKLVYGAMTHVRVTIVDDMSFYVAKAVTIAIRYSAVRHQSELIPGKPEPQILDYQTQQYKLLPILASSYAFRFSSKWLSDLHRKVTDSIEKGDTSQLPELHAMACCLKAVCTADAAQAVETARLSCGGHGYMACSNLPSTYGLVTAANTYEGENTVLLLQTARALVKAWTNVKTGKTLAPIMSYLSNEVVPSWSNTLESFVDGFKIVAAAKVSKCIELLQQGTAAGLSPEHAWNATSVQLVGAAEAHCRAFLIEGYVEALHTRMKDLSPELKAVMQQLCELYCVYWTLLRKGDFLLYTGLHPNDVSSLEEWQSRLLTQLRPNAVGLVDAFDFRDEILDSTLGAWDGQVYQRLLDSAMKSPLNAKPVHNSFHASIVPMLKAKY